MEQQQPSDKKKEMKNNSRLFNIERRQLLAILIGGAIATMLIITTFSRTSTNSFLCSLSGAYTTPSASSADYATTPAQLLAILHYATSPITPQQTINEIRISFDVLQSLGPCNFLVFGLGHDSLMWAALNTGPTLFLEEDPKWVQTILQKFPILRAQTVNYHTRLSEADHLLAMYKSEPDCMPPNARIRGETRCKLALPELPDEVFEKEWDVIMIDAPRGYFPEAPGRMGAIFTAAVFARGRKSKGVTHVFLHDVNRKVESVYAKEFLCMKYKVHGVGRLWHFEIPAVANGSEGVESSGFC